MSRNHIHKIEGKFNNGLIDYKDIPENVKNKWDRKNFDRGKYKKLRKSKTEKELNKTYKT